MIEGELARSAETAGRVGPPKDEVLKSFGGRVVDLTVNTDPSTVEKTRLIAFLGNTLPSPGVVAKVRPSSSQEPIIAEILDNNFLRIGEVTTPLDEKQIFYLSLLMAYADSKLKGAEVRDLYALKFDKQDLRVGRTMNWFTVNFGVDVVLVEGNNMARTYSLSPNLGFKDMRSDAAVRAEAMPSSRPNIGIQVLFAAEGATRAGTWTTEQILSYLGERSPGDIFNTREILQAAKMVEIDLTYGVSQEAANRVIARVRQNRRDLWNPRRSRSY